MYTELKKKTYKRIAKLTHKMSQKFTRRLEYRGSKRPSIPPLFSQHITPGMNGLIIIMAPAHRQCQRT